MVTLFTLSRPLGVLFALGVLAQPLLARQSHLPRAQSSQCALFGDIDPGNGGRSVGLVIDSSGSMVDNDPDGIRLKAARALVGKLISPADATGGKTQDLVAVVSFSETAELLYPLGATTGASGPIDSIEADGGTFIGGGVKVAADELAKAGNYPGPGHRGIVVLTDGKDDLSDTDISNPVAMTVEAIKNAAGRGIRVSFGFLSIDSSQQDAGIVDAVFSSGGTFTTIRQASDIEKFVAQVLLNGLTGPPNSDAVVLLPGLNTASLLSKTGPNTFTYKGKTGERFNVTVQALQKMTLTVTLRDRGANTELKKTTTDPSTNAAFLEYTATSDTEFEITVTGSDSDAGIFSVNLESSIDPCQQASNSSTTPPTNTTVSTGTPTPVQAGAGRMSQLPQIGLFLALVGFVSAL